MGISAETLTSWQAVYDALVALVGKYYNVSWDAYGDYLSSKDFRMADMLMTDIMKNCFQQAARQVQQ